MTNLFSRSMIEYNEKQIWVLWDYLPRRSTEMIFRKKSLLLCGIVVATPMDAAKQFLAAAHARKLRISPVETHPSAAAPASAPKKKQTSCAKETGAMAWFRLMGLGIEYIVNMCSDLVHKSPP